MKGYQNIVKKVLKEGEWKENRTGIDTLVFPGAMFQHNMKKGFPLLTTKKIPFKLVASELEFFLKGLTDKKWLQERNNHIWDEWCNPELISYAHDEKTKKKMIQERDLGPIYGWQWRNFGAKYEGYDKKASGNGIDQLAKVVDTIKNNPSDRRMIVTAWNPINLDQMALPPCHYSFQIIIVGNKLNLAWNQRSVDTALGLPFNIASYALLLHLLAKEGKYKEGILTGFLGDTHIYRNHIEGLEEQLQRNPRKLPTIRTDNFTSIFKWKYEDSEIESYNPHPRIQFDIAV